MSKSPISNLKSGATCRTLVAQASLPAGSGGIPAAPIKRKRFSRFFCALISLLSLCLPLRAEVPEPHTVFYGQIINRTGGQLYVLTEGRLVWRMARADGSGVTTLSADLQPLANGRFSYRLNVPHEALAPGATVSSGAVALLPDGADYQHMEITVDGFPATILPPAANSVRMGQTSRAAAHRLDLEVFNALPDSDGDGMPDWWERRYGLNPLFAGDAGLDPDHDGASNLKEFKDGSDPNQSNVSPMLATDRIVAGEGGVAGVRLRVLDSDSQPADLRYTLLRAPQGGTLYLRNGAEPAAPGEPASDRLLLANDTFTQADVDAGRLIFQHRDLTASAISFQVAVRDENADHAAATGTVAVAIYHPSSGDGTGAGLWLDANHAAVTAKLHPDAATNGSPSWLDRSGHNFKAVQAGLDAAVFETTSLGGNESLRLAGQSWDLAADDGAEVFPPGDRTVIAVFKSTGSGRQQVLSSGRFELGITAVDDPRFPDRVRYAGDTWAVYGPKPTQWVIATAWEQDQQAVLELNGLWAGERGAVGESTALGARPSVGGKISGTYDANTRTWQFAGSEQFSGALGEILTFNEALPVQKRQQITAYLLSKWLGCVAWDASAEARPVKIKVPSSDLTPAQYASNYVARYGRDRSHLLIGGAGNDELCGGMEDDILIGGAGDDQLTGGGGRDVFVINPGDGNDAIWDFTISEGDVIDVSRLLKGASKALADYAQLSSVGTNSWLRINPRGDGGPATVEIKLANTAFRASDLQYLWANGHLVTGGIGMAGPVWVNVAATVPNAGEEGPVPGEFTLTRTGPADTALTVNFSMGGTAANGVDYSLISAPLTFAPGQSVMTVPVQPYNDGLVEVPEVAELVLLAGSGYNVGASSRARVTIADLPERISIQPAVPVAGRNGQVPGYIVLNRSGVTDRSTVVRLSLGGQAVNGVDYQRISPLVSFSPGQAAVIIPITPMAGLAMPANPKTIDISILPDLNPVYVLGAVSSARLWLVDEVMDLNAWRARWLPGETSDLARLAALDRDSDGLPNLVEYAFGLNPNQPDGSSSRAGWPRAKVRDGHLSVEFKKLVAATDLEYVVEVSDDLLHWHSGAQYLEEVSLPEFANTPEMVCFHDRTPAANAFQRYIRVQVRLK